MAAPTFTLAAHPAGYDQTQKRFTLSGLMGLSGNYTITTGIPIDFTSIINASGARVLVPPTYTGVNGPGQSVPISGFITGAGGYVIYYDSVNKSIRIWTSTTELASGALPAALTAAGIYSTFTFLRG